MKFFTVEKLGPKQAVTPEGFLVCQDAVLARTGLQIYGPGETPLDPGPDGLVRVERDAEEVFDPDAIASFQGKPVVNDHPEYNGQRVDVTTDNWRDLTVGWAVNAHRGSGINDDVLMGDLLITDRDAIDLIRSGKREISLGYDADYQPTGEPGRGRQVKIRGNHIALVDHGRCGPRCAIGDQDYRKENSEMSVMDKVKAAFRRRDEQALDAALAEIEEPKTSATRDSRMSDEALEERFGNLEKKVGDTADKVARIADKFDALPPEFLKNIGKVGGKKDDDTTADEGEGINSSSAGEAATTPILNQLELEAPTGTNDAARKARDSRYLEDSYQETLAIAEILVPGIEAPAFRVSDAPAKSVSAICGFRRKVIDAALRDDETKRIITDIAGDNFDTRRCSCSDVRSVFRAAGAMKRAANNMRQGTGDEVVGGPGGGLGVRSSMKTIAEINARHRDYYKSH